ncbi:MAG: MarR family winged helix-turn-helix transcriptional regulator [Actinomycetes bacterium]
MTPPRTRPAGTTPQADALLAAIERLRAIGGRMWDHVEDTTGLAPMQAHAMEAIAAGARQVSAVAEACGRHVSSTSRLVDGLVAKGLVDRAEDPTDRRGVVLTLTAAGREKVAQVEALHGRMLGRVVTDLGPEEAAELTDALARFSDRLLAALDRAEADADGGGAG